MITTLLLLLSLSCLFAQNGDIENEIKKLEQQEVQAVLTKDTVILKKLWHKNYVVNNPENKIVVANANPLDRPVLQNVRRSFTREVEHVTITGDIAISMGNETVVPAGEQPKAGTVVKRRYTNIWQKTSGEWKLVARHANIICATN